MTTYFTRHPLHALTQCGIALAVYASPLATELYAQVCVPPPGGLVSWWRADGNALDSGGTNNGTLLNGAAYAPGVVGDCFAFNGTNSYVDVGDDRLSGTFTIEAWVMPTGPSGGGNIVCKGEGDATVSYFFGIQADNSGIIAATVVNAQDYLTQYVTTNGAATAGIWQHLALTYDGAAAPGQKMQIFLNGTNLPVSVIGSYDAGGVPRANPSSLKIGIYGDTVSAPFIGLIDELSLYNRVLSSNEIAAIFLAGAAGKCRLIVTEPQSQVGFWGKSATFSVVATSSVAHVTYQWQKDGAPIPGATNAILQLPNLQFTNAGGYSVIVSDGWQNDVSATAYLTVNPAGVSIALYAGVTIGGVVGYTYGIQSSTNLSTTNWVGVTNMTLTVPVQIWYDSQPASLTQRYYRVLPGPIPVP